MDTPNSTGPTSHTLFPLIVTEHMRDTVGFYENLLGLEAIADVGWYVQLAMPGKRWMQLAVIEANHDSVPAAFRAAPAGVIITVEVDDVDAVHVTAVALALPMHSPLRSEDWGQRHFITEDPAGLLVDVVTPIPPTPEFLVAHGLSTAGEPS